MIETKEQYEEAYSKTNSTVRECLETIEALREVARDANYARDSIAMWRAELERERGDIWTDLLLEILELFEKHTLPDWIKEDG